MPEGATPARPALVRAATSVDRSGTPCAVCVTVFDGALMGAPVGCAMPAQRDAIHCCFPQSHAVRLVQVPVIRSSKITEVEYAAALYGHMAMLSQHFCNGSSHWRYCRRARGRRPVLSLFSIIEVLGVYATWNARLVAIYTATGKDTGYL